MKLSLFASIAFLLISVNGTGDRGTYERMLLYNAYIAEEIYKPGEFTIAPGCEGTRPKARCTYLELIQHVWVSSQKKDKDGKLLFDSQGRPIGQATMPGAGPAPKEDAPNKDKIAYYKKNLGAYWRVSEHEFKSQYGLKKDEDGRSFATRWVDDPSPLERKLLLTGWDKWMDTKKMASGATSFAHVFDIAADAIISARVHLDSLDKALSTEDTALFKMAEKVGTTIENLRVEDGEKHRTGGKAGTKKPVGKGDIVDMLKMTTEFKTGLTPEELNDFKVETKSSGIQSTPNREPWQVFDPVATAAKWSQRVPNIESVMDKVQLAYTKKPAVLGHAPEIEGIRNVNQKMKNWDVDSMGLCSLGA